MTNVLHASWSGYCLHLWLEDGHAFAASSHTAPAGTHPFALPAPASILPEGVPHAPGRLRLLLPSVAAGDGGGSGGSGGSGGGRPLPSPTLERVQGAMDEASDFAHDDVDFEDPTQLEPAAAMPEAPAPVTAIAPVATRLEAFEVVTLTVDAQHAEEVLAHLDEAPPAGLALASDAQYWCLAMRFAQHVMAQQRFVPMLVQVVSGELRGAWRPWLADDAMASKARLLIAAMPAAARAADDAHRHDAWTITEDFLACVVDASCRRALVREDFAAAIEGRPPATDPHVAWLAGLLGTSSDIPASLPMRQELAKRIRMWIGGLEERGASAAWRLQFRLNEPIVPAPIATTASDGDDLPWGLTFHLQSADDAGVVVDADDIWLLKGDSATIMGRRLDGPQELLLKELGRASRFYKRLEVALAESEPARLSLPTRQAYEFLREVRPILLEQGFGVDVPVWWDSPLTRVGAKLVLSEANQLDPRLASGGLSNAARAQLGLATLVNYKWEISVGDATLSIAEFEQLAAKRTPLVRVNGRWVEVRPEDVQAAVKFIKENPGGTIRLSEAMRLAYASELKQTGIPVVGLQADGWLQAFMNSEVAAKQLEMLPPPQHFRGTLRPYQSRGVSWMMFQERLGFGICLADDMGLGKTVQLLALLSYEREGAEQVDAAGTDATGAAGVTFDEAGKVQTSLHHRVPPTLLLVPMSVLGNWVHETRRFCPQLKVMVHHGPQRPMGDAFYDKAAQSDLIITTYSLAHRDRELLEKVRWGRVVLDEAQYIKNPTSKQAQAVRSLEADHRVALTGTPVENRLTELWSIMDFLNPGYLGGSSGFRARFAVPIERYHDKHKGEQLRSLIRPFVLRRLKSDPTVVADLPAKLESKEFSHLTAEQAQLYEACVKRMLAEVDAAEGLQRRGLVLSSLIKLKQVCNHPAQALKEWGDEAADAGGQRTLDPTRSGKCIRLLEMLDEVLAEGDQCLIFTQFRQMGRMLEAMIRQQLGTDVLFIHGGTPQQRRQQIIEQFQAGLGMPRGQAKHPVLLLSLRAGGVGLNLTAATHVFHFDRWWNPAVENQATDRAYRIGQTRTVQVHKFVVRGTLEERIDQMIESKSELAANIIGQGEQWLTELSTDQLRDILTLRNDAIDDLD